MKSLSPNWTPAAIIQLRTNVFHASIINIISRTSPVSIVQIIISKTLLSLLTGLGFDSMGPPNGIHLNLCLNHIFAWDTTAIGQYVHL